MRVLITGGTGFVGSHLAAALAGSKNQPGSKDQPGCEIQLFTLSRQRAEGRLPGALAQVQQVFCDLRDPSAVRQVLKQVQPDAIIHLASISPVAYSYDHPNEVFEVNLLGAINLAESCRNELPALRHFLFASTSETYGLGPLPKKEDTPQNPSSPYGLSKFAAERYLLYLRDAYTFPLTILRPFNTYGRKDTASFVVERIISQMLQQDTIRLGDPAVVRDWLHIDDHVEAYRSCLGNERAIGQILNFCTGRGASVAELVDLLSAMIGFRGAVEWHTLPKRPLDVPMIVGDAAKAASSLPWQPRIGLEHGLQMAVDYWRKKMAS
jgi:GDP-4-dehydro-6-deoxy-D-mannose reductase